MSEVAIRNMKRVRAIAQARAFKALFMAPPAEVEPDADSVEAAAERVFFGDNSLLTHDAQKVLADLRDFCGARTPVFHSDPLVMARRAGRLDVWLRVIGFLNLDEKQVQTLMEIDDGY